MRNFKKFLTLVLAVMMVVSAMSFTTSAAFEDVAADNEYLAEAIDLLSYMGVAKGVSETKFGTDELVTRQQFALFIYRMMKGGKDAPANGANSTNFTDLVDPTYNYAISWAYQNGIVSGRTSTTFDPKGAITLQEAYAMIVRALEYEADGEKLAYPFGYIEVAEKETVNLPEGLASSVDATDALTRGDMAILLYNAFFAEVGVAEVEYAEKTLSDGSVVLIEEEDYPRLCEKFFEVKEVEYQAVGTPHFRTSTEENTLELGYDAILFDRIYDEPGDYLIPAPVSTYIAAEDIAVDAKDLDNYFLAHFTMFVTLDDDNAIEKVLYASSNMNIKTVDEIKLGTVATNKQQSYYAGTNAKLLSGKATAGDEVFYFFNAPYSYAAPTYTTSLTEAQKYILKNEENIGTVSIAVDDINEGTYVATVADHAIATSYDASGFYTTGATTLATVLDQVYYGGLYEADLYDVDGDNLYDYIDYKPYTFFQVNTDEDYNFFDYGVASTTTRGGYSIDEVYTTDANLLGEKFEDEDYVIGYYSQTANTIKVAEVVKPVTATVKSFATADKKVTLNDGTTVAVDGAWKLVSNFKPGSVAYDVEDYTGFTEYDNLLAAANIDDDEIDLYVYDGVVLYEEGAQSAALTFSENLLIPTADEDGRMAIEQFNTAAGKMMTYIYAWVDGDLKWIPVETDDDVVYPVIANGAAGTIDSAYFEELCTYSVGADGVYTVTSLAGNIDADDKLTPDAINNNPAELLDDEDDEIQYIATNLSNVLLKKRISTRFELVDATSSANLLSYVDSGKTYNPLVNLTDATRIVIKNNKFVGTPDAEVEFIEYDVKTLITSSDVALNNVSVVLVNDIDQTNRENLLVLYGEANDFDLKGLASTTGYRIVRNSDPYVDENGYYRFGYKVLNPFTGKEETIAGNKTSATSSISGAIPAGAMVDLKDGKINDVTGTTIDTFNGVSNTMHAIDNNDAQAGLVWILDYDAKDNVIVVGDVVNSTNWYDIPETGSFTVDNNTVVTLLKHAKVGDLVAWGDFSALTIADIATPKNEMKCYSDKVPTYKADGSIDTTKAYKTGYAKYLKAYIVTENETNLEEGELNKVTFITVIANNSEDLAHLTTNKRP